MQLRDKIVIINDKNMNGLQKLYGDMGRDDLERIVNNHIAVAIEEIREDISGVNAFDEKYSNRSAKDFEEC